MEARGAGDLFYWDDYEMVCASRFGAVDGLLRDRRFGREAPACVANPIPAHLVPFYENEAHSMLEREPPVHTRLRAQVMREFTGRRVAGLSPEIERLTHQLIDGFPKGPFDLLGGFAEILPVTVIARMLGVGAGMERQLLAWSHDMVAMYQARRDRGIEDRAVAATTDFSAFIKGLIEERRARPLDDMISALVSEGAKLSDPEIVSSAMIPLFTCSPDTRWKMLRSLGTLSKRGIRWDCCSPRPIGMRRSLSMPPFLIFRALFGPMPRSERACTFAWAPLWRD